MAVQGLSTTLHRILLAGEISIIGILVMRGIYDLQIGYNSYEENLASLQSEFAQHQQCGPSDFGPLIFR
jgi:hypothetical protein